MFLLSFFPLMISTHTPHARRDSAERLVTPPHLEFLLTRLMRGVTAVEMGLSASLVISTHTPHARRDTLYDTIIINAPHFYSHASCEA